MEKLLSKRIIHNTFLYFTNGIYSVTLLPSSNKIVKNRKKEHHKPD